MSGEISLIPLGQAVIPIERPEVPCPGKRYRQLGVRLWGEGAYERKSIDGSETNYKSLSRVEENDIVVNKIWARNGSVSIVNNVLAGCYVSGEFPTFTPIRDKLEPRWFYWLTKTKPFWEQCDKKSRGTSGQNRIRPEKFLEVEIPLPLLEEQRRIVARIEELATKVEEARGLRRQSVEGAEGLLKTTISNLFLEGAKEGWAGGRLGGYVLDDCYGTSERTTDDESGTPILRMGNIQNGCLDLRDLKYFHLAEKERQKLLLKKGDILVNRTNSAELVGKCAVFDIEGEYAFASYIIRLRLDIERADPRLVAAYINSPAGRTYMFSERKQMTGQANVNATKLKALPITLPSLSEQHRIVAYLDNLQAKVDTLKRLQTETAAEVDALLPSILDKAFKGEL